MKCFFLGYPENISCIADLSRSYLTASIGQAGIGQAPNQWPIGSWPLDNQGESSREHHTHIATLTTKQCDLQNTTSLSILVLICLQLMSLSKTCFKWASGQVSPKGICANSCASLNMGLGTIRTKIPVRRIAELLDMELVDASPQSTWIGPWRVTVGKL